MDESPRRSVAVEENIGTSEELCQGQQVIAHPWKDKALQITPYMPSVHAQPLVFGDSRSVKLTMIFFCNLDC